MIDITSFASGSKGNCYRISDSNTQLLLECGISYKEIQKRLDFKISNIAGCLITHEHKDHSKSVKDLLKYGIDCYMSKGTADAIGVYGHRVQIVKSKQQFKIGSWTILPFDTEHDSAEPLGFLLTTGSRPMQKLLYITDSYYCRYRFQGLNYIMIECNYAIDILKENTCSGIVQNKLKSRLLKSHFELENVKKFLQLNDLSKVKEIWLLHLSDNNSDEARFKNEIQELTGKPVIIA